MTSVDYVTRDEPRAERAAWKVEARARTLGAVGAAVLFGLGVSAPGPAAAQDRGGFYAALELGAARGAALDTDVAGVNHPTRCDRLLYAAPGDAPTDAACTDDSPATLLTNSFSAGSGFAAAAAGGYALGALRVEAEFLQRRRPASSALVRVAGGNAPLLSKDSEWSPFDRPSETVSDFVARQLFVNVYYDAANASRWTPFAGAGVGAARTAARYRNRFVRRTDLGDLEWQNAAEGTVSLLDAEVAGVAFGAQALAGVDYAVDDRVSLVAKFRWAWSDAVEAQDLRWTLIRSHEPVQADGATPFTSDVRLGPDSHFALTLGVRIR